MPFTRKTCKTSHTPSDFDIQHNTYSHYQREVKTATASLKSPLVVPWHTITILYKKSNNANYCFLLTGWEEQFFTVQWRSDTKFLPLKLIIVFCVT